MRTLTRKCLLALSTLTFLTLNAPAGTLYVDINSTNSVTPYPDWSTAATNIQDAVDAAAKGDLVLVNDGVYQTGGRAMYGTLTNRVVVTKALTVQSVNGPGVTTIRGYQVPGTTNGDAAIRCVVLAASGATLSGFTLTNGATRTDENVAGGVLCGSYNQTVSNCVIIGNSASYCAGGAYGGHLINCTLAQNSADYRGGGAWGATLEGCTVAYNSAMGQPQFSGFGGGVSDCVLTNCMLVGNQASKGGGGAFSLFSGMLSNCTLTRNSAYDGGGAYGGPLYDCILENNSAGEAGGGAFEATMSFCTLTNNTAPWGGGAAEGTLNNCTLSGNQGHEGGGACGGTLNNCTLSGNQGLRGGGTYYSSLTNCLLATNVALNSGGAYGSTLINCTMIGNAANGVLPWEGSGGGVTDCTVYNSTLIGNFAAGSGGGAFHEGPFGCILNNCIIYYNTGGDCDGGTLNYCCTTMLPVSGAGNFTNAPLFVDTNNWSNLRLESKSPCINAGLNAYVVGATDLDGNPRISGGTVDLGAYEFQNPASTISYAWLQQFGLPMDGTADGADGDQDGMSNWQEWRAGTDPTNGVSVLQMLAPTNGALGVVVTWQSVTNRSYYLQRSLDLSVQPPFVNVQSNVVGQVGTTSYTDTNAVGPGPLFYRVGVQ